MPPAFTLLNPNGRPDLLLTAEHAGDFIPPELDGLGLPTSFADPAQHLNALLDVGVADLAHALSIELNAPAVLATASRLVVECNRWPYDPEFVAATVQGVLPIVGNAQLDHDQIAARARRWFWPYHQAITRQLDRSLLAGYRPAILSLHSFAPIFHGQVRDVRLGVLWDQAGGLAESLLAQLARLNNSNPEQHWQIGNNQPYDIRDGMAFAVNFHGAGRGLPAVVLEVRSDLIETPDKAQQLARMLAPLIENALRALIPAEVA